MVHNNMKNVSKHGKSIDTYENNVNGKNTEWNSSGQGINILEFYD